jgi:hypothetical protein
LLEVMVALAILGMALVVLIGMTTSNVRATHHARMVSAATFLARAKIAELEDVVLEEGFVDTDQEEEGDFNEEGYPHFLWKTQIERLELPTDMTKMAQDKTQEKVQNSRNPMMAMAGFMGGFMTTLIEPIRVGLEESVRRVAVTVSWNEPGKPLQTFEVVTFMTDPAKLDMAVSAIGAPPGGAPGAPGGGGAAGVAGAAGGAGAGAAQRAGGPTAGPMMRSNTPVSGVGQR